MLVDQHQSCNEEPKVSEVHPARFLSVQVRNLPKAPQSSRKIPHSRSFSYSPKKNHREQPKDIYNTAHTRSREKQLPFETNEEKEKKEKAGKKKFSPKNVHLILQSGKCWNLLPPRCSTKLNQGSGCWAVSWGALRLLQFPDRGRIVGVVVLSCIITDGEQQQQGGGGGGGGGFTR